MESEWICATMFTTIGGGEGCYGGEAQHVNIVNNYYKPGPGTDESGKADRAYRIAKPDVYPENYSGEAYKNGFKLGGSFISTEIKW